MAFQIFFFFFVWQISKPQNTNFDPQPNPFPTKFTEIPFAESEHKITMCVYGNISTTPFGWKINETAHAFD